MKKLISMLLALVMTVSLATVAFAAEGEAGAWDGNYDATSPFTFNVNKTYTSTENFVPLETLSFTVKSDENNPNDAMITVEDLVVTDLNNVITVKAPSFTEAGVYEYTIQEKQGNTAGVTSYDDSTIHIVILVEYDNQNHCLKINNVNSYIKKVNGTKTDTFENEFKTNDFTVAKDVTGNMASETDEFQIQVRLYTDKAVLTDIQVAGETVQPGAWQNGTYETTLNISKNDGPITFADIPYGVTVTVSENNDETVMNGYTFVKYTVNGTDAQNVSFVIGEEENAVVVLNEKTAEVDTGITLDSVPFLLILAVCIGGAVLFVIKKRHTVDF